YSQGAPSVTVAMPTITGLPDGSVCTFSVSLNLKDAAGNFIIGAHTVQYTISSSGSTINNTLSGTWNEAATSTNTASVGSAVGSAFQGMGGQGVVLTGLLMSGSQSVNGIAGLWSNGFSSTTTSTGPIQGQGGAMSQVTCPAG